jgi:Cdc6-like AAA superfamily ATPase
MALTFNKIGFGFAKVVGGKYNDKVISINPSNDGDATDFKKLKIANESKFQLIPNTSIERQIIYVTGPSGSGKSTFCCNFLKEYKKKFKNNEIYLFSALSEDDSLDKVSPKRFKIDSSLYEDPIDVKDLENSVVIFDDVDCVSNKKIRDAIYQIMDQILQVGRHWKISALITLHLPTAGKDTRKILNESHMYVYFPQSAGGKIKYLLEEYLDIDRKMIKYFKKANSRYCCISKNYPAAYLLENEVGMLHVNDDTDTDNKKEQNKK